MSVSTESLSSTEVESSSSKATAQAALLFNGSERCEGSDRGGVLR